MSSSRLRTRLRALPRVSAALVLLAGAVVQPVFGALLIVSAVSLGRHAGGHAHSVAVQSDGNHVDVVLSHREADAHERCGESPEHFDLAGSESDHVVHVALDDATNANVRRNHVVPTFALAAAVPLPIASLPAPSFARPLALRAGAADHLRSVVLRL